MKVSEIKIGETYNGVKVLEKFREKRHTKYWCICPVCEARFSVKSEGIGKCKSCEPCRNKARRIDLSGRRFGRLTVIERVGTKFRRSVWRCVCDCGKETTLNYTALMTGNTRSCGCWERENRRAIGIRPKVERVKKTDAEYEYGYNLSSHPAHKLWRSIKNRCYNLNCISYRHYGGRGIKVCDRWLGEHGFENFIADMGERPGKEYSIDRIDVNGDYCPENCRWATDEQQANNKTDNVYIIVGDKEITAKQFCKALGLNYWVAIKQIQRGYDINVIAKDVRFNQGTYRRRQDLINHNRVVSDEVIKLLENK